MLNKSCLGALFLGSALLIAACAPAPVDKGESPTNTGGTNSAVQGGTSPSGNGGTSPSGNGGTTPGGNGGTSPSGNGGTTPGGSGGTTPSGNGGTSPGGTGGTTPGGTGGTSGGNDAGTPAANGTKVPADVQAVFMKCGTACHGGNFGDATKTWTRLNEMTNNNACKPDRPRMKAGDGMGSLVVQFMKGAVAGCGARMPKGGAAIPMTDIAVVEKWIQDGAKAVP